MIKLIKKGAADLLALIIAIVVIGVVAVVVSNYISRTMLNADEQVVESQVADAINVIKG